MANRYWVGGTGTWSSTSTTKWSATSGGSGGASVPTSSDNVYIDANSGTGTITITIPVSDTVNCFSLTVTRANVVISGFAANLYVGDTGGAVGSGKIEFSGAGNTSTSYIDSANIYIRGGASSSTTLSGYTNLSMASCYVYIIQGTVKVSQQIQSVYTNFYVQSGGTLDVSSNTQFYLRTLDVQSGGTIDITSASVFIDNWYGNGTVTGASSVFMSLPAYNGSGSFQGSAAVTYATVKFGNSVNIYGNQAFNFLQYNYYSKMYVENGKTITVVLGISFVDFTYGSNARLSSISGTFTLSKASGSVSLPYLIISNCNATGGATFSAPTTSVDAGNNTGISFANSRGLLAFFS